jgi:hypothetical protein
MASKPMAVGHRWPRDQVRGVYLFSEGDTHHYVGRTNHVQRRYGLHSRPSAQHNQAVFAFKLARHETGNIKAAYSTGAGSRTSLAADPVFGAVFVDAKARVKRMDFRWIEETDPVRQCLLEVYVAIVLQTAFNDFDNH